LFQALEQGVREAGGVWDEVTLADLSIERCRACNHCQRSGSLRCVFDGRDDTPSIFARMAQADLLVYASPVYVFGISSLLKCLLERFYSRAPVAGGLITESGLFFHPTDRTLVAKPFVSILACDNMEDLTVRNGRDFFRIFSRFMDAPQVGHLERRSAAAWCTALDSGDAGSRDAAAAVLAAYRQAGVDLVSRGRIAPQTRRRAQAPFVQVPLLVRVARHLPFLRAFLSRKIRHREGVMSAH